ncbi:MAG: Flagellar hook protein FlgE [uncultured Blastococcus sp.]|uniref:Flagellar hook protein FlgE n=1 Tax=uncultured Blastococcus sp. TaxID=217144 RepID=A0A6J4IVR6_9ACTN|nr:MAG: Flagellar hook protein FlgE [uncultured Blastococcus sp.]
MLRSMFSAISGLRAHQTKMDVTGNNIANVNTVGFKASQTVFQDTLSQVIRAGGGPAADRGGTNPAQVGLGAKVAAITTNWTQGATQSTGRSEDFMIEGDGFFVTRGTGGEQLFTRAGSFSFDAGGRLVTPDGAFLQGWMAGADGAVNPNNPVGNLSVPIGQLVDPSATTAGAVKGNLPSDAPVGTSLQTATVMFDSQGVSQQIAYAVTKTAANTWDVTVSHPTAGVLQTVTGVTFGPDGKMTSAAPPPFNPNAVLPAGRFPSWDNDVQIDISQLTQYGSAGEIGDGGQDGYAVGSLQSFQLGADGTIMGTYSNELKQPIGRLALASFNNPGGLEKAGNSSFRVGVNSGAAQVGPAGAGGRGELVSGALEMSNVDLAEEFTGLIVAQRGFQANSRVITSSDEILQDLVNLKR